MTKALVRHRKTVGQWVEVELSSYPSDRRSTNTDHTAVDIRRPDGKPSFQTDEKWRSCAWSGARYALSMNRDHLKDARGLNNGDHFRLVFSRITGVLPDNVTSGDAVAFAAYAAVRHACNMNWKDVSELNQEWEIVHCIG
jgi:hypothetical protein